jgi:hypothetical protein
MNGVSLGFYVVRMSVASLLRGTQDAGFDVGKPLMTSVPRGQEAGIRWLPAVSCMLLLVCACVAEESKQPAKEASALAGEELDKAVDAASAVANKRLRPEKVVLAQVRDP